jgi:hypothetical protein
MLAAGSELTGEQLRQQIDSRRNKRAKMPPLPSVNTAALARKSRANDELASLMMDADDDDDEGEETSPGGWPGQLCCEAVHMMDGWWRAVRVRCPAATWLHEWRCCNMAA